MTFHYVIRFAEAAAPSTYYYVGCSLGRSTLPTDTPASTHVPGNLQGEFIFSLMLFDGVEPSMGNSRGGFGAIVLSDPEGTLDSLNDLAWDGGSLTILRGLPDAAFSTYDPVAVLTTSGLICTWDRKEIRVRDLGWLLQSAELHTQRFDGTGGLDGDSSVSGKLKPWGFGECFNCTPVLYDPTNYCWMVNWRAIDEITDVLDGRVALTFGADYASHAALVAAAAPAAGHYNTSLADGVFRTNGMPVYGLTVDFKGDAAGGYVDKRGDIAKRVLTADGTALDAAQVDSTALSALNTAEPDPCSFYWTEATTKLAALNQIMAGCMGCWWFDLQGVLHLGLVRSPVITGAAADVTWDARFDIGPAGPAMTTYQAPRHLTEVTARHNYTILQDAQLADTVTGRQQYKEPYAIASATTAGVLTAFPTAPTVRVLGHYANAGDASAAAGTIQQHMGTSITAPDRTRSRWVVPVKATDGFEVASNMARVAGISNNTRYAWSSLRKFQIVGIEFGNSLYPRVHLWV